MADDAELPYLRGVDHVSTYAGTVVIFPYPNDTQSLRCILRQFAQVYYRCGLFLAHKFYRHRQGSSDDLIDLVLDGLDLLISRAFRKNEVALALLPFDVGVTAAGTFEHIDHRPIQDMLRSMGRLVFGLVVTVEYRFFHISYLTLIHTSPFSSVRISSGYIT